MTFYNDGARTDYGFFTIKWNWDNEEISPIPADYIKHSDQNLNDLAWLSILDPVPVDRSQFLTVPGKHVVVYYEPGRFGAWPANNGIWNWGNEILVGFLRAFYKENKYHHSIDRTRPMKSVLARSLDGGETWTMEDPENFIRDGDDFVELKNEINFTHPDLAMRFTKKGFFTSYTRGKSWEGPYKFPNFHIGEITTRTDYLVNGQNNCLLFLSAKDKSVKATLQDRSFCAQTTDGGKSFKFISWMAETDTIRSVMSSTVRMSENHLITALRRRYDPPSDQKKKLPKNYIDVHESLDNGKTWNYLHKIADTDRGIRNGNPPSLVKLPDGRICVTYGYRNIPYSIRARISTDKGKTWSKEILLRDDARKFDIGYTQSIVREDGKIVTV
ncbi:MAG: exo-alpha-sialidase, partial [Candidatus Heimdallarchaeota archaeon]|nr:exo-alpha-sialidase [Candidatus Heimdallarchaeota archaeon]